jgi:hypothetical protein
VVRRQCAPGQRRLVGRIDRLSKQIVYLSESFDKIDSIHEEEVWLEGSKASFSSCLKAILGDKYKNFESALNNEESKLLIGPAVDTTLTKMHEFLAHNSPFGYRTRFTGKNWRAH